MRALWNGDDPAPVSYTHLDVYKRQLQVLQTRFDPSFSKHSHGFRPGRSQRTAVCEAGQYIAAGRQWVVDVDLEKFFDRVNHDMLMARLEQRIEDKRLLRLIRRYLNACLLYTSSSLAHGLAVNVALEPYTGPT